MSKTIARRTADKITDALASLRDETSSSGRPWSRYALSFLDPHISVERDGTVRLYLPPGRISGAELRGNARKWGSSYKRTRDRVMWVLVQRVRTVLPPDAKIVLVKEKSGALTGWRVVGL